MALYNLGYKSLPNQFLNKLFLTSFFLLKNCLFTINDSPSLFYFHAWISTNSWQNVEYFGVNRLMNRCFRHLQIIYCFITTLSLVCYIQSPVLCLVVDFKTNKQKELKFKRINYGSYISGKTRFFSPKHFIVYLNEKLLVQINYRCTRKRIHQCGAPLYERLMRLIWPI